jgi:predicted nucleotide-binding protein (sugar kinase/HSP70/actin superfamily)
MAHAGEQTGACPYIRALPSLANAYFERPKTPILEAFPEFYGKKKLTDSLEPVAAFLKLGKRAFEAALEAGLEARRAFGQALAELGTAGLKEAKGPVLAVLGRMYNTADPFVSLRLPEKIAGLGFDAFPMDLLPTSGQAHESLDEGGYWFSQDRILKAGAWIKGQSNVYGVYFTNFGCGPDAFIQRFFEKDQGNKPWLLIEADEHSADAGVLTRLEAFLERIA